MWRKQKKIERRHSMSVAEWYLRSWVELWGGGTACCHWRSYGLRPGRAKLKAAQIFLQTWPKFTLRSSILQQNWAGHSSVLLQHSSATACCGAQEALDLILREGDDGLKTWRKWASEMDESWKRFCSIQRFNLHFVISCKTKYDMPICMGRKTLLVR